MPATSDRLRIVVLGSMGRCPFGGQTWMYLNWLLGLHRCGHEVWYVEDEEIWPHHPVKNETTDDCTYAVGHVASSMAHIGMPDQWVYRLAGRQGACWGLSEIRLAELYSSCDVVLNVAGETALREEHLKARLRVYLECDPVTAELKLANGDRNVREAFDRHHVFATYGENYAAEDCGVPLNGITYRKTRQPVALDFWPAVFSPDARFFTTIGNYRQAGWDVAYNGQTYSWSKHHEWEKFLRLASLTAQPFELGLKIDDSRDQDRLEAHGWRVVSPLRMSLDVFGAYQEFIRRSRAEFTVAKDQNVRLRSGWFSERDACYLACGKPVVAQDTGFSKILPTGKGLYAFTTIEQALSAIEAINSDYQGNCTAARAIAEDYFAAEKVASRLLQDIGLT